jgi:CBS domain-containing protein
VGVLGRIDVLRAAAGVGRRGVEAPRAAGFPADLPVERVMREDVPSVGPQATLPEVLQAVVSTRLNMALVVDGDRRVVGMVSDAELMDRMARASRPGLLRSLMRRAPYASEAAGPQAKARRAADLMVTGVPTARPGTPLGEAIGAMLQADRKILAVVDETGRLAGIVDRADLLRGLAAPADGSPSATPAPVAFQP